MITVAFFLVLRFFSLSPWIPLVALTHRHVGSGLVSPLRICSWTAIMGLYGGLCHSPWMFVYVALYIVAAVRQYRLRWHEMCHGELTYSGSTGYSVLHDIRWLPCWLIEGPLAHIVIEPLAWCVIGLLLLHLDKALALWIVYGAAAQHFDQKHHHKEDKARALIRKNNLVIATSFAEELERFH
jgi:hypothetical protein